MRTIKFRAWDKNKGMSEPTEDRGVFFRWRGLSSNVWIDFELMQFTGLLDKNGKEIYEGDIIRYETSEDFDAESTYDEIAEVKFINGVFDPVYLSKRELHTYEDALLIVGKIEVIGNIYENPELLTK